MKELIKATKEAISEHPSLKDQITDLFELAMGEIEDGESPDNELSLFLNSVDELIEDENDESEDALEERAEHDHDYNANMGYNRSGGPL